MLTFINVDVALRKGGQWLLIVRGNNEAHAAGKLSLVGGTFEETSTGSDVLEKTARREVTEEVGITLDSPLTYVESTLFTADNGEPVVNVVFAADLPKDVEPFVAQSAEVADIVWRTLPELSRNDECPSWTKQSIERAGRTLSSYIPIPVGATSTS